MAFLTNLGGWGEKKKLKNKKKALLEIVVYPGSAVLCPEKLSESGTGLLIVSVNHKLPRAGGKSTEKTQKYRIAELILQILQSQPGSAALGKVGKAEQVLSRAQRCGRGLGRG